MTDVASLGVWPLGTFAWCVRSARTAPFRTRSLRAALLTSRLPQTLPRELFGAWEGEAPADRLIDCVFDAFFLLTLC